MKKILRLTETELIRFIKNVIKEDTPPLENLPVTDFNFTENVKCIQKALIKAGFGSFLGKGGPNKDGVDGLFGNQTKKAVQEFQKKNGIRPTGFVGDQTAPKLGCTSMKGVLPSKKTSKEKSTKQKSTDIKIPYSFTPRIDAELNFILARFNTTLFKKIFTSFFVYDPKDNLVFLFDKNGNYVAHTSVVDGADTQKSKSESKIYTTSDWCKASGLLDAPHQCTDPTTKEKKQPAYYIVANLKDRFIPKGIYSISSLGRNEGYTGKGKNVYYLKDIEGKDLSAALHGIPDVGERLRASDELEKRLRNDISSGKVPEKYLSSVKQILAANQSFGCVGLPAKFLENPKVIANVTVGMPVFVMGDTEQNYLVMNSDKFFEEISGDGVDCQNPLSIAQQMGTMV